MYECISNSYNELKTEQRKPQIIQKAGNRLELATCFLLLNANLALDFEETPVLNCVDTRTTDFVTMCFQRSAVNRSGFHFTIRENTRMPSAYWLLQRLPNLSHDRMGIIQFFVKPVESVYLLNPQIQEHTQKTPTPIHAPVRPRIQCRSC